MWPSDLLLLELEWWGCIPSLCVVVNKRASSGASFSCCSCCRMKSFTQKLWWLCLASYSYVMESWPVDRTQPHMVSSHATYCVLIGPSEQCRPLQQIVFLLVRLSSVDLCNMLSCHWCVWLAYLYSRLHSAVLCCSHTSVGDAGERFVPI